MAKEARKTVVVCKLCGKPCGNMQGFKLHLRGKHGIVGLSDSELEQYIEEIREGTHAEIEAFKEKAIKKMEGRNIKSAVRDKVEETKEEIKSEDTATGNTYADRVKRREAKRKAFLDKHRKI